MNSLRSRNNQKLLDIYQILFDFFGPQGWWPGESKFEILVGAVLTQNTSWKNVEKSIKNLKEKNLLNFEKMAGMDERELAMAIKSSGFYNQKAKRLKNLLIAIVSKYGSFEEFLKIGTNEARKFLLSQEGIGRETADSIILYAMERPVFVVDAYTFRIFERFGFKTDRDYDRIREGIEEAFNFDVSKLKEFHALLVELGKSKCKKIPLCQECPLNRLCQKNI